MSKEEMLAALAEAGIMLSEGATAVMTDEDVQAVYAAAMVDQFGGGKGYKKYAESRDEMIVKLAEMGEDPTQLEALSDEDLMALYQSKMPPEEPGREFSEIKKQAFSLVKTLKNELATVRQFSETLAKDRKRDQVDGLLKTLVESGRVMPSQRDGLRLELMDLSDEPSQVREFSENGRKYKETPFMARIRRLKSNPIISGFREKLGEDPAFFPGLAPEDQEAEVREFAEAHSRELQACGKTVNDKLEQWRRAKKANPQLTPAEFLTGKIR